MTTPDTLVTDPLGTDLSSGVHHLRSHRATTSLLAALEEAGWATSHVDLRSAPGKSAILAAFAEGLGFPDWVGRNWDALDDALQDLSWWPPRPRGRLMVVRGADRASVGTARDREFLRDILGDAAARWAVTGPPLVVLLRP